MLLDRLKAETADAHTRLERRLGLAGSLAEHQRQLALFYGFVAAHEEQLANSLPATDPVRTGRGKREWLAADLRHYGWSEDRLAALPRPPNATAFGSRAEALGAAYVLEGATLGGQFISRHLESTLGLKDGAGYTYFQSYGPRVRLRWQEFREELVRASSAENDDTIVRAARECFERLDRWMEEGLRSAA